MEVFDFQRARHAGVHDVGQPSIKAISLPSESIRRAVIPEVDLRFSNQDPDAGITD